MVNLELEFQSLVLLTPNPLNNTHLLRSIFEVLIKMTQGYADLRVKPGFDLVSQCFPSSRQACRKTLWIMFQKSQAGTFLLGILGSYCPLSFPEPVSRPHPHPQCVLASYHLSGSLPEPPAKTTALQPGNQTTASTSLS